MFFINKRIVILKQYSLGALLLLFALSLSAQSDSGDFTQYFYENGKLSSEGWLKDGKPEHYWKSYYRNGQLKSEGNRVNFELDSLWVFYNRLGQREVEIEYEAGLKQGERRTYQEGRLLKREQFERDRLEGWTYFYHPEEGWLQKEIAFEDNKVHGQGFEYDKEARVISLFDYKEGKLQRQQAINRYDEQRQKQGVWIEFHANRSPAVEGLYRNDLKNGYWKYYQSNGNLIRVEKWVNGELQEAAQEVAKVDIKRKIDPQTGKLAFKGAYQNGVPTGVHRFYNAEGEVVEAKIYDRGTLLFEGIVDEEGRKQGPWKHFYPDGALKAEGAYRNDEKYGPWKYFYPDGSLEQEGSYLRGLPDGFWVWYHPNGQEWREEEYVMGKEDGPSLEYDKEGQIIAQGEYIEGEKEGPWKFKLNDYREEGAYFEGRRQGSWRHYQLSPEAEQLIFEGLYENGVPQGLHQYFWPNGQLRRRGQYRNGRKDGIWEYFNKEGLRILSIQYSEGEETHYDGKKINYGRRYRREMAQEQEN